MQQRSDVKCSLEQKKSLEQCLIKIISITAENSRDTILILSEMVQSIVVEESSTTKCNVAKTYRAVVQTQLNSEGIAVHYDSHQKCFCILLGPTHEYVEPWDAKCLHFNQMLSCTTVQTVPKFVRRTS